MNYLKFTFIFFITISYANNSHLAYFTEFLNTTNNGKVPPPTISTNLEPYQYYLFGDIGNDIVGLNAQYAWQRGITGQGVQVADIEFSWNLEHSEFSHLADQLIYGPGWRPGTITDADSALNDAQLQHGTAVLGILVADSNGLGTTGMVYGADKAFVFSESTGRSTALKHAIDSLNPGDVLVLEMQTNGGNLDNGTSPGANYVPAEYQESIWQLTRQAVDQGIIVVAAAGNGNEPLDSAFYSDYIDRGHSGAIIVGAANHQGRTKASFSTHGKRVDLAGYGNYNVYTTGYGDFNPSADSNEHYTTRFAGTSSATPMVAGAVALVQSFSKTEQNHTLTPSEVRSLLKLTGTLQGDPMNGNIGPIPNIQAAIELMESTTPQLLTVNDGRGTGLYYSGGEVILTANPPGPAEVFTGWVGDIGTIQDPQALETEIIMPNTSAQVTATYGPKEGIDGNWKHYLTDIKRWDGGPDIQNAVEYDSFREAIITQDHQIYYNQDSIYKYTDDSFASHALSVSSDGVVWQSDGYKIYEFNANKLFTYYEYGANTGWDSQSGGVTQPQPDDDGNLWFSNLWYDSIFVYDGVNAISVDPFAPQVIRKDPQGRMWFGGTDNSGNNGLIKQWNGTSFEDLSIPSSLVPGPYTINDIEISSQGAIWVAIEALEYSQRENYGGVLVYQSNQWTHYQTQTGLLHNRVLEIEIDSYGQVWIGSEGGLSVFYQGIFKHYPPESWGQDSSLYQGSEVKDIAIDSNEDIWIAARGIHQLQNQTPSTAITSSLLTKSKIGVSLRNNEVTLYDSFGPLGKIDFQITNLRGQVVFQYQGVVQAKQVTLKVPELSEHHVYLITGNTQGGSIQRLIK